jgi:hypothetical protein
MFIAKSNTIINYSGEIRMKCRFSVTGIGNYIRGLIFFFHFRELPVESLINLLPGGKIAYSFIEITGPSALAVDTIEVANFSFNRKQVNPERNTQPSAFNGPEYYIIKKKCSHFITFLQVSKLTLITENRCDGYSILPA